MDRRANIGTPWDAASALAQVYVTEALGNETLVRLQIAGETLVARAPANYEPTIGQRVWVRTNPGSTRLFDATTEERIA